jgi:hypothetical protein
VRPGDTVRIEVGITEQLSDALYFSAKVLMATKTAVTMSLAVKRLAQSAE